MLNELKEALNDLDFETCKKITGAILDHMGTETRKGRTYIDSLALISVIEKTLFSRAAERGSDVYNLIESDMRYFREQMKLKYGPNYFYLLAAVEESTSLNMFLADTCLICWSNACRTAAEENGMVCATERERKTEKINVPIRMKES